MKTITAFIKSLRPRQWTKNLIIFAGILFSRNIFNGAMLAVVTIAFVIFCIVSGSVYVMNDICDAGKDRRHPEKSKRPIAAGWLSIKKAAAGAVSLVIVSLVMSLLLGTPFFLIVLGYILLQAAYSIFLKNVVIIDVFALALGYVLRVVAGALVIQVEMSSWLIVCTILLSLFLGLSKRRYELTFLEDEAEHQRSVLGHYSPDLLDQMISVITASTAVSYALYTVSPETVQKFGTRNLIYTVPFVLYGIFRYLYLIHQKAGGGSPENILLSDVPLLADIVLWIFSVGIILYV